MKKKDIYSLVILVIVSVLWGIFFPFFRDDFFSKFFYMPFLGVIAATVANTTPAAAGIVYFPILTRLEISPIMTVQFTMLIQAYGMGLGTLKWYFVNKRLFIFNVLPVCLSGGLMGVVLGIVVWPISKPEVLTLIFNFIAFMFTQVIFFSILYKRQYPAQNVELTARNIAILLFFSFIGGLITGWIGFGIDTIFYFILTLVFRVNPAIAIVTSIAIMATMSLAGAVLHLFLYEVPLSLWYSAIPGVTLAGLFLAAFLAIKLGAKNVLLLFTLLLSIDFFLTLWTQQTIPISYTVRLVLTYALIVYLVFIHVKIFKQSYKEIGSSLGEFKGD
ncbi:MAG: sulfite exporter TauE/SafE family protein [Desulfococcaceae bacterium]